MASGVQQQTDAWIWTCPCGASGERQTDREKTREEYKQHRRKCGTFSQQEGSSVMSTTAKKNTVPKGPQAVKSGTPKKAAGKKAEGTTTRKRVPSVSATDAKAALDRLKKGETSLIAESKRLGFTHNGPLRSALRELVGREAYDKIMKAEPPKKAEKKAATKKAPSGGKKGKAAPAAEAPAAEVTEVAPAPAAAEVTA